MISFTWETKYFTETIFWSPRDEGWRWEISANEERRFLGGPVDSYEKCKKEIKNKLSKHFPVLYNHH